MELSFQINRLLLEIPSSNLFFMLDVSPGKPSNVFPLEMERSSGFGDDYQS